MNACQSKNRLVVRMKKRLIAIVTLAALSWPSVPALAMLRHIHNAQGAQAVSQAQDHSCCPEATARFVLSTVALPALPPVPCEDSPCCARQAPSSSLSLPGTIRLSRPDFSHLPLRARIDSGHDFRARTEPQTLDTGPFQLSSIRSIIWPTEFARAPEAQSLVEQRAFQRSAADRTSVR